jgi:hypothetical protein
MSPEEHAERAGIARDVHPEQLGIGRTAVQAKAFRCLGLKIALGLSCRESTQFPPIHRDPAVSREPGIAGATAGGGGQLLEKLANPPHPVAGFLGVFSELLCHAAGATSGAEPADGVADRIRYRLGSQGV